MHRRQKYSARAFYLCILLISAIAIVSLFTDRAAQYVRSSNRASIQRRGLAAWEGTQRMRSSVLSKKDEEVCADVTILLSLRDTQFKRSC